MLKADEFVQIAEVRGQISEVRTPRFTAPFCVGVVHLCNL